MSIHTAQNAFTSGEISPRLFGRVDIESYKKSASLLSNFVVLPHGGIQNRSGTKYHWEVKDSSKVTRLVPFEVNQDLGYLLEFGDEYIRIGRNGSLFELDSLDAYNAGTTYAQGGLVTSGGIGYYSLSDGNVGNTPASSPTYWYPLTNNILELPSPYTESELSEITFSQSSDVLWIFHENHKTKRLERYADTNWLLVNDVRLDGPYGLLNYTTTTLTPSAATGSVTVTASSEVGINGGDGFQSTDVGRLLRIFDGSAWAWGEITAVAATASITVLVVGGSFPTGATTVWKLGRYSDTTGYPRVGTLHEARLAIAETEDIDLSKTDSLSDFGVTDPLEATDALSFKVLSREVNEVRWMTTTRGGLAIGTSGGEWLLSGGGNDTPLTPSQVLARQHSTVGGASLQGIPVGNVVLFVSRTQRGLHEFAYVFNDDSYRSPDMLLLAEHLTRSNTIVSLDYQRSKSILWCVRDDGLIIAMTYQRENETVAWHRHQITGGTVKSVVCINEGDRDTPYFIVERTVNGSTVQYVESIADDFRSRDLADAYFVDCGIVVTNGSPTATVSGLDHLEGEDVWGVADGKVFPLTTVSGGEITLPYTATQVSVGLPYTSDFTSVPIETGGLQNGTSMGRIKQVSKVALRMSESYGCKASADPDQLDEMIFNTNQVYGVASEAFTGEKEIHVESAHGTDKRVYLQQYLPLPLTVNALIVEFEVTQS